MAEGLAALGVVANIAQAISLGIQLWSECREIHQATSGQRKDHHCMEILLENTKQLAVKAREAVKGSEDGDAIRQLATECEQLARDITDIVDGLKIQDKTSS
jgi:hypothetical protein